MKTNQVLITKDELVKLYEMEITLRTLLNAGWGREKDFHEILGMYESMSGMDIWDMAEIEVEKHTELPFYAAKLIELVNNLKSIINGFTDKIAVFADSQKELFEVKEYLDKFLNDLGI